MKIYKSKILTTVLMSVLILFSSFSATKDKQEDLLGITFDFEKSEVTIQVASKGCTNKSDFKFEVKNDKLTIYRKKSDNCKKMPEMVSFTYSIASIGLNANKKYNLVNKIIANPNTANLQ